MCANLQCVFDNVHPVASYPYTGINATFCLSRENETTLDGSAWRMSGIVICSIKA